MAGTVRGSVRTCVESIRRMVAAGEIPRGSRVPSPGELARRLRCEAGVVQQAYRELVQSGEFIEPSSTMRGTGGIFACAWSDFDDPAFTVPAELGRATGWFFSYKAEEPDERLHLKVTRDDQSHSHSHHLHGHDFCELVIVQAGAGVHIHGGARYPIYRGDCFVVLPGEMHGYDSESTLSIVNVIFYDNEIFAAHEALLREMPGFAHFFAIEPLFRAETSFRHKLHLSPAACRSALDLAAAIESARSDGEPGCRLEALAAFLRLVVLVSRTFARQGVRSQRREDLEGKLRIVERAIAGIEQDSAGAVRVGELARSLFLSPSRLQHIFKQSTGVSLIEYLLQVRIDHACSLLRDTRMPVMQVAGTVGFHDRGYFARQFRRKTGLTPLRYRHQHRRAAE